jgi:hypothetical protein
MRKRFLIVAVSLLVAIPLVVWVSLHVRELLIYQKAGEVISEEEISRAAAALHGEAVARTVEIKPLDARQRVRLAIGSLGFKDDERNRSVGDLLLAQISGTQGLEMIERQAFDKVLDELNLNMSGLVRASDAVRVGKLLRADWFLLGSSATIQGTNFTVVRLVDASSGILRDAGVFEADMSPMKLAEELAKFIRESRRNATVAKQRVYLSAGVFEDVSVNQRLVDFPTQLRSYFISAYQHSDIKLLEREFAGTLLRELNLDLAGLAEKSESGSPTMQDAYWMVDGYFQSYETTNHQVELVLNVQRMFGPFQRVSILAEPGEALFKRLKTELDAIIAANRTALTPSRVTEVQSQLAAGKESAGVGSGIVGETEYIYGSPSYSHMSPNEFKRLQRNTIEALRAFETVLLLDPQNREAKVALAACFRRPFIGRTDEARNYYREIIESEPEDKWSRIAKLAIVKSFNWQPAESRKLWFEVAAERTTTSGAKEFYLDQARLAANDVLLASGQGEGVRAIAEERLFETIRDRRNQYVQKRGVWVYSQYFGMSQFVRTFDTNEITGAQRLVELLPRVKQEFSEVLPHFMASALYYQKDTNSPLVGMVRETIELCLANTNHAIRPDHFFGTVSSGVWEWAYKNKLYEFAVFALEQTRLAADRKLADKFEDMEKMSLAYSYMALERWKDALDIFQSYSNRAVRIPGDGPWGKAFRPILTRPLADECRIKLGMPIEKDPNSFVLTSFMPLDEYSAFTVSPDGLWIVARQDLVNLGFDLQTNVSVRIRNARTAFTSICSGPSNIWVGTKSSGLIEYEKASKAFRRITEKDGLLSDAIAAIHLAGESLWIGFSGGMSQVNLESRRIKSFMARLDSSAGGLEVPSSDVLAIASARLGEIWTMHLERPPMANETKRIKRYDIMKDAWENLPPMDEGHITSFAVDGKRIVEGMQVSLSMLVVATRTNNQPWAEAARATNIFTSAEQKALRSNLSTNQRIVHIANVDVERPAKLNSYSVRDQKWNTVLNYQDLLSSPQVLCLDGNNLWMGGRGYVALVDVEQRRVKKICHISADEVDRIQVGGGYVWVQFEGYLHRVALSEL